MGGGCRTAAAIGMPYEALKKKKGLSLDRAKGRGGGCWRWIKYVAARASDPGRYLSSGQKGPGRKVPVGRPGGGRYWRVPQLETPTDRTQAETRRPKGKTRTGTEEEKRKEKTRPRPDEAGCRVVSTIRTWRSTTNIVCIA